MKNVFKSIFFSTYSIFSRLPTRAFSDFFVSLGYFIKSEALYNNNNAEKSNLDRLDIHATLASKTIDPQSEIVFLEFGVFKGQIFNIWVEGNKNPNSKFVGFDTFTGLPEDWGSVKKGSFSAGGTLPNTDDPRVSFCVGLIQDTLPEFVKTLSRDTRKVIHIDVDLYNATLISLIYLHPFLKKGDLVIFDDFFTVTKASHEFRAFLDYQELFTVNHKPLINVRNGHYAIEIV